MNVKISISINIILRVFYFVLGYLYAYFYDYIFKNYMVDVFGTFYVDMTARDRRLCFLMAAIPMLFYGGLKKYASVFSLYLYIFVYVPFNESLSVCGWGTAYHDYKLVLLFCMCFCFASDGLSIFKNAFRKKPTINFQLFERVSYVLLVFVVLINIRNLHFTNFIEDREDLYDLRADLNVVGGTIVVYLIFWQKCVILPFLMVYALIKKNIFKFAFVFAGFIFIYMIDQQKLTFVMPLLTVVLFFILRFFPNFYKKGFHIMLLGAMVIFPYLLYMLKDKSDLLYELAALVVMRTQCIEGIELNTYLRFFGHDGAINPYTYYTHIGIVNALTGAYPYDTSLGHAVTYHGANANGCFWLMDGIAAAGLWGIVISTLVFIVFKSFFNNAESRVNVSMFSVISLFSMSMMVNVSLFTAIFSCGFLLMYILFIFLDLSVFQRYGK